MNTINKHMMAGLPMRWLVLALVICTIVAVMFPAGLALAAGTNRAAGKVPTGSIAIQNAAYITNGNKTTSQYAGMEVGAQWIRIDLGQAYTINQVNVWHYFGDGRTYHDVIVQVSNSSTFSSGVTTVFNNDTNNSAGQGAGSNAEYAETSAGKTITFAPISARYVRLWTNGSSANSWNHYVEVEVFDTDGVVTPTNTLAGPTATRTNTPAGPTATRTNTPAGPTATKTSTPALGNLALNKPATASSIEGAGFEAAKAVDGSATTRWASVEPATTAQWIYVDLGATSTIARVVLNWEAAYATSYQVQTSNDATSWTSIYTTTTGNGGIDDLTVSGSGRYVRVNMTVRGTTYGYSLWAFEVYGSGGGPTATNTQPGPTATRTNTPVPPTATRTATATSSSVTHPANEMFDDFNYTGPTDGNLTGMGWVVRVANDEGPGPAGADWLASNISFVTDPSNGSNKLMQLRATTNGTGSGTKQAEIYTGTRKYLEGTYAARVRFTDAPESGSYDGDEIVETFFSITPLNYDLDPNYSENDFEYLANGGWGSVGPTLWVTTWETYRPDPWLKDGISDSRSGSLNGWHTLIMTVSGGHVIYYLDGTQIADHSGKYYPETLMSINFNLWIIADNFGGPTTSRTWLQEVDWVYFARNTVLTQAQVNALLADFRAQSITRRDNVP